MTSLTDALLVEHSKANAVRIAEWIGEDESRYAQLIDIFINAEYRPSSRAGMVVARIHDCSPQMIIPHLPILINVLRQKDTKDAVKRNTLRALESIPIPEKYFGDLLDICFGFLTNPNEAIAIRVFSMGTLWNICQKEPELLPELRMTIEDWIDYGSAGFKNRGKKILKAIHRIENNRKA